LREDVHNRLQDIIRTCDLERAKQAVKWLHATKFKPGYFFDSPDQERDWLAGIITQYTPILQDIVDGNNTATVVAMPEKEDRQTELLRAQFEADVQAAFAHAAAPERGKGVQMKEVWVVKNPTAYIELLRIFLTKGGNTEKLDFLVRFAERASVSPPSGVEVVREPIVRI